MVNQVKPCSIFAKIVRICPVSVIISYVIGCLTVCLRHILGLRKDVSKSFYKFKVFILLRF